MEYKVGDIVVARNIHNENKEFIFEVDGIVVQDGVQLLYGKDVFSGKNVYAVHGRYCKLYSRSVKVSDVERLSELTKEEHHRMPQGLDRDSRHKWAKETLSAVEKQNKEPIESDGKSSSYYDLQLSQKTIDFITENGYVKTEMLIYDVFDNDFDFSNAFKSLVRAWGTVNGAGKKGNSLEYELNKIDYSVNKIREYRGKE